MKKQFQSTLFAACILTLSIGFTACRSEAPEKPANGTLTVGGANITITAGDEGFNSEATRASQQNDTEQTVAMGDGLTANISIEKDAAEDTRATKNLDGGGTYSVFAIDPVTHKMILGSDGHRKTLKGKFVNGNFVRTEGALTLAPGTYKFVCVNEAVTVDATASEMKYRNGKDPMIGVTEAKTISAADRDVNIHFIIKHMNARIRIKLMTYKANLSNLKAQIGRRFHEREIVAYLDGTRKALVRENVGVGDRSLIYDEPFSTTVANTALGYEPFYTMGEYLYFLPNNLDWKHSFIQFNSGTIYGKAIPNDRVYLWDALPDNRLITEGESHTIRFALTPYPVYLFADGKVGLLEDANGRTPVGLVARHKKGDSDNKKKGLAIALRNAGVPGEECIWSLVGSANVNDHQANTAAEALDDLDGYHYTWDAMQGYTKANERVRFPAFYYAAQYSPAVTGTNISKWFFPSIGEWAAFWKMVKFKMETDITRPNTINLKNGPTVANLNQLFTQVGGAPLLTPSTHNTYGTWYNAFHTSTERDYMQAGTWFVDSRDPNTGFTMNPGTVREDNEDMYVRSFVHF